MSQRGLLDDLEVYISAISDYVIASPTSYHAARIAAAHLAAAGFEVHEESDEWRPLVGGSRGLVVRDGAIIAWRAGAGVSASSPVRILGAHTDSPGFVLKPHAQFEAAGWEQLAVEVYGGPLLTSWLDRDLGVAGRLVDRAGQEHLARTGAIARIPQLAIHLDREANTALTLDRQRHTQPIIAADTDGEPVSVLSLLAASAGISEAAIAGVDARLFDTQKPELIGANSDLLAAGRMDNLSSTFAGLAAILETEPAEGTIAMVAAFDHEELGSNTRSGASGPFLEEVLARIGAGLGASVEERARAFSNSWCISADAGHSIHPNYQEKHDPRVRPLAGRGPMLKINANQRYATDAHGAALWARACEAAGVPSQEFVSNNTVPCGSTIGPLTATRLGIRTVDVGVPLLSMHSARELAHVRDLHGIALATGAFFAGA
ncbi:M18 family aminopeptidase [Leucobacter sp. CSA2]|uniref:M18 family aminopeptidase n=1 Tax=Leucobacter edaphi TaxID=2796472 RepID=A0A934QB12_9MICO|nr:M18 family aminopeptidase [Leucobacter edaphi]MBK0420580.1 M18 family aminopeptidase [Leucobacter edaphi]